MRPLWLSVLLMTMALIPTLINLCVVHHQEKKNCFISLSHPVHSSIPKIRHTALPYGTCICLYDMYNFLFDVFFSGNSPLFLLVLIASILHVRLCK